MPESALAPHGTSEMHFRGMSWRVETIGDQFTDRNGKAGSGANASFAC